ncbi:MAG: type IV pilus twitching motility protein PilT [Kiritimatiellia bacterium]|jgi:twitching motility protein PilT
MWKIDQLLGKVATDGGSDLILTVGAPPQIKVLGVLHPVGDQPLTVAEAEELCLSVLNEAQRQQLRERRSVDLSKGFTGMNRFRFNVFYQRGSLALAARLIPYRIPSFRELGLPPVTKDFAMHPHGLVLVTGPAGSGKSTTLAAMIEHINTNRTAHVICIEDPIEYLHHHKMSIIEQREVYEDAPDFAQALQSVFRQSPDVIMVGEMRDMETMQLALTLAETGHLILATLHTQDTIHAINRIVDVFPPAHQQQIYTQLSMVLAGVISQTLLLSMDHSCRVLACEVLRVNNAVRNLIRERQLQQVYSVIQTGKSEGMVTMNESLRELVAQGRVDADLAMERSPRPRELARMLGIGASRYRGAEELESEPVTTTAWS